MNKLLIKVGEFFGVFKPAQEFLKGKKTILSSIAGMLISGGQLVYLAINWSDGQITAQQFIDQATLPATIFWAAVTFLWSAFHAENVVKKETLGPAK